MKTVNYALGSSNAFVLFLVDVTNEEVYFLPLQDYFIANPDKFKAAENNATTVTLHLEPNDNIKKNGNFLVKIAKSLYYRESSMKLYKIVVD